MQQGGRCRRLYQLISLYVMSYIQIRRPVMGIFVYFVEIIRDKLSHCWIPGSH